MHTTVIDGETIAASGAFTSKPVAVPGEHAHFSLQWVITGNGTAKFECLDSNDGITYILDTGYDIETAQTKTTGPGSDGINKASFSPRPSEAVKIICTETGGANSVTVTAVLVTT